MNPAHTPELSFLLAACPPPSAANRARMAEQLATGGLDGPRLFRLAERHRVAPFLLRALREQPLVPPEWVTYLRATGQVAAVDGLLKLREYDRLAGALTRHGVPHRPLKGVFLAKTAYPDPSLRPVGDLDVLIDAADLGKTIAILGTLGYRLDPRHALLLRQNPAGTLADLNEVSLFNAFANGSAFNVDLHWEVLGLNKRFPPFTLTDLRAHPDRAAEFDLLLLVAHHGLRKTWQRLGYVSDLYFFLQKNTPDWPWLRAECHRRGLEAILGAGLHWCHHRWGLPLPAHLTDLLASARVQALATAYEADWERTEDLGGTRLVWRQTRRFAQAQPRFSQRVRAYATAAGSRIFRVGTFRAGGREVFVPKPLGFVLIAVRGVRRLVRGAGWGGSGSGSVFTERIQPQTEVNDPA